VFAYYNPIFLFHLTKKELEIEWI